MPKKTSVVVAENQALTRKGYVKLLQEVDHLEVAGEAENGKELIKLLENKPADLVLLDLEMPVMNGREALRIIKSRFPYIKVIILSFHTEETMIVECIKLGACSFICKDSSYEVFIESIRQVNEEGYYYNKNISKALANELSGKSEGDSMLDYKLTERETEIVMLICEGKTNKEIAGQLNIVVKTVDFHKANIYRKTKTYTSAGLYNYALKSRLISKQDG